MEVPDTEADFSHQQRDSTTTILPQLVEASENKTQSFYYKMDDRKEKAAILFFYDEFVNQRRYKYKLSYVREDRKRLYDQLSKLGFEVHIFNNEGKDSTLRRITNYSKKNLSCLLVYVSSRDDNGLIQTKDKSFTIEEIKKPIMESEKLVGIPKILLFQIAEKYTSLEKDGGCASSMANTDKLPTHADMFIVKVITTDKFERSRSLFVNTFCHVLDSHHEDMDLKSMMILTNNMFVKERKAVDDSNAKKNILRTTDTHRKLLYFRKAPSTY